jgi:hypothetical protein
MMVLEKVYDSEMKQKYNITELNEMYKGIPTDYEFGKSRIDVYHKITSNETYRDPWDYLINVGDVHISVNGQTEEILRNFPVKVEEQGLNQYTHYVSYWLVEEKSTNKVSFIIVLQMNGNKEKELPNGDIEGFVPKEETKFTSITIQENGTVSEDHFTYKNKNKLQTKLIPPMSYGGSGYYTDAWYSYPIFFFPFIYPFFTTILGLIFILISIPFKKKNS